MSAPRTGLRSELAYLVRDERSRELAAREGDGLCVQLLWDAIADAVSVEIEDRRAGKGFHVAVGRRRALDAFYHPFAYAAWPRTPCAAERKLTCPAPLSTSHLASRTAMAPNPA